MRRGPSQPDLGFGRKGLHSQDVGGSPVAQWAYHMPLSQRTELLPPSSDPGGLELSPL